MRTRRPLGHVPYFGLAVLLVLVGTSCDVPKRNGGLQLPVAGVPFLDTDPLPQPPPRAELASAQWVSVSTGYRVMPEPVLKPQPSAIAALVETHGGTYDVRTVVGLRRLAFGRLPPPAEAVEVDANALAELGFTPPGFNVWLFGPEGQCRANVTVPMVGIYDGPGEVLELSWRLEGCPDIAWAPVGVVAEQLPRGLQWIAAQPVITAELDVTTGWDHPLAPAIEEPSLADGEPADAYAVQVLEVLGPRPAPVEVLYAHLRYDPEVPDDPCPVEEAVATTHGFWNGQGLRRFEAVSEPVDVPVLLGAIVQGEAVEALVYADGPNAAIAVPPTPPPPDPENAPQQTAEFEWGPPTWTRLAVPAVRYGRADLDAICWTFPIAGCNAPP